MYYYIYLGSPLSSSPVSKWLLLAPLALPLMPKCPKNIAMYGDGNHQHTQLKSICV